MSDKYGERCPICRTKWKITKFGKKVWKDCLECDDTAENLMKKAETERPEKKYEGSDWLVEFAGDWPADFNMPSVNPDADDATDYYRYSSSRSTVGPQPLTQPLTKEQLDEAWEQIQLDLDDDDGGIPFLVEYYSDHLRHIEEHKRCLVDLRNTVLLKNVVV